MGQPVCVAWGRLGRGNVVQWLIELRAESGAPDQAGSAG